MTTRSERNYTQEYINTMTTGDASEVWYTYDHTVDECELTNWAYDAIHALLVRTLVSIPRPLGYSPPPCFPRLLLTQRSTD